MRGGLARLITCIRRCGGARRCTLPPRAPGNGSSDGPRQHQRPIVPAPERLPRAAYCSDRSYDAPASPIRPCRSPLSACLHPPSQRACKEPGRSPASATTDQQQGICSIQVHAWALIARQPLPSSPHLSSRVPTLNLARLPRRCPSGVRAACTHGPAAPPVSAVLAPAPRGRRPQPWRWPRGPRQAAAASQRAVQALPLQEEQVPKAVLHLLRGRWVPIMQRSLGPWDRWRHRWRHPVACR